MKVQLEEFDHNLLGVDREIYLEDDKLVADISVRQKYTVESGDYFYPETVYHEALEIHVNSIYFVTDSGKEINVFSREMVEFVKESIEIEY